MLLRPVVATFLACAAAAVSGCGDDDGAAPQPQRGAAVARPSVEGPVTGGNGAPFVAATTFDLAEVGYAQTEYFLSGTATAYRNVGTLGLDGVWEVEPAATADYRTRMIVHRPIDRRDFNGTVIVEWLNVSGGLDAAADWIMAHTELTRSGYAWVGVSAQAIGVEGGTPLLPGLTLLPLKEVDPVRYASLDHPGDSFSFDIFAQAAQALRRPGDIDPLGGLRPQAVIAAGESQSAFRLSTYINGIHPRDDIFDGFLVHSRGSLLSAPLSESPLPTIPVPGAMRIRTDLNAPVLTFQTETDLTFLGFLPARQPDSDTFRLWEVAGTAHADTYTTVTGMEDRGDSPAVADLVVTSRPIVFGPVCARPINSGPQHFVLKAAIHALNRWVREGVPPPSAPRIENNGTRLVRDEHGNVRGGIRTPQVDVPIATLSGEGQLGEIFCLLFGTTVPFDAAKLATLYPTPAMFRDAFTESTDRAVAEGFLLPADAALLKSWAASAPIGG